MSGDEKFSSPSIFSFGANCCGWSSNKNGAIGIGGRSALDCRGMHLKQLYTHLPRWNEQKREKEAARKRWEKGRKRLEKKVAAQLGLCKKRCGRGWQPRHPDWAWSHPLTSNVFTSSFTSECSESTQCTKVWFHPGLLEYIILPFTFPRWDPFLRSVRFNLLSDMSFTWKFIHVSFIRLIGIPQFPLGT